MVGWASVAVSNCFLVRENHRASHAAEVLFLKQAVQVAKYGREGLEPKTNVEGKEAKRWVFFVGDQWIKYGNILWLTLR